MPDPLYPPTTAWRPCTRGPVPARLVRINPTVQGFPRIFTFSVTGQNAGSLVRLPGVGWELRTDTTQGNGLMQYDADGILHTGDQ